jgi:hypothetical protein
MLAGDAPESMSRRIFCLALRTNLVSNVICSRSRSIRNDGRRVSASVMPSKEASIADRYSGKPPDEPVGLGSTDARLHFAPFDPTSRKRVDAMRGYGRCSILPGHGRLLCPQVTEEWAKGGELDDT